MIATRSPTLIPEAIKPLATDLISSSYAFAVTACQPSPSGRETITRSGSKWARSAIKFVRFPAAAGGIIELMVTSFMGERYSSMDIYAISQPHKIAENTKLLLGGNIGACHLPPPQP
jgi:hypothetical protein